MSDIFNKIGTELNFQSAAIIVGCAILMGAVIALIYRFTHRNEGFSSQFMVTLVMVPTVISLIIMLIGSNLATAFSIAGVFSLIRYRSTPGNPKDLTYVLMAVGIGVACGTGYVGYGAFFVVVVGLLMIVLDAVHFGSHDNGAFNLRVTIPESINYDGLFDEVMKECTSSFKLRGVMTTNFGTLYEMRYTVKLKKGVSTRDFMDKIRALNGNLDVIMTLAPTEKAEQW